MLVAVEHESWKQPQESRFTVTPSASVNELTHNFSLTHSQSSTHATRIPLEDAMPVYPESTCDIWKVTICTGLM